MSTELLLWAPDEVIHWTGDNREEVEKFLEGTGYTFLTNVGKEHWVFELSSVETTERLMTLSLLDPIDNSKPWLELELNEWILKWRDWDFVGITNDDIMKFFCAAYDIEREETSTKNQN